MVNRQCKLHRHFKVNSIFYLLQNNLSAFQEMHTKQEIPLSPILILKRTFLESASRSLFFILICSIFSPFRLLLNSPQSELHKVVYVLRQSDFNTYFGTQQQSELIKMKCIYNSSVSVSWLLYKCILKCAVMQCLLNDVESNDVMVNEWLPRGKIHTILKPILILILLQL